MPSKCLTAMLWPEELDMHDAPAIRSGAELLAGIPPAERARFAAKTETLKHCTALELLPAMQGTHSVATLWALHLEFHRRGIPPILRGPRHELGPQGDFLDLAADLLWLQRQWPEHRCKSRLARAVFKAEPDGPIWHGLALAFSASIGSTRGRAISLGLHPHQRHDLRSLADASTRRRFDGLHGEGFGGLRDALISALVENPDRSGRTSPADTASRRAFLWRIHQLSGQNHQRTAQLWALISGQPITRQQTARHIAAVAPIAAQLERSQKRETSPP